MMVQMKGGSRPRSIERRYQDEDINNYKGLGILNFMNKHKKTLIGNVLIVRRPILVMQKANLW